MTHINIFTPWSESLKKVWDEHTQCVHPRDGEVLFICLEFRRPIPSRLHIKYCHDIISLDITK